jgi:hypothetical protein
MGVISIPALMLHTVLLLTDDRSKMNKVILSIAYIIALICLSLNTRQLMIADVSVLFGNIYYIPLGYVWSHWQYGMFMLYFKVTVAYLLYLLYGAYRDSSSIVSKQRYLFFGSGIGIGFIGGESCFLPTYGFDMYPYLGILIGIYPVIIGYSIIRHRLFDARYAILQILRILSITTVSLGVGYSLYSISEDLFHYSPSIHLPESGIALLVFIIGVFLYRSSIISGLFLMSSFIRLEEESRIFLDKRGVYPSMTSLLSDIELFCWSGMKIKRVQLLSSKLLSEYPHIRSYWQSHRGSIVLSEIQFDDAHNTGLIMEVNKL